MKFRITFEGDYYEDFDELKSLAHLRDLELAFIKVKSNIRSRIKWGEGVTENESKFLDELEDILNVQGLD